MSLDMTTVGTTPTSGAPASPHPSPPAAALVASTARIVDRFSTTATVALVALTVAGVALSADELGSFSALTSSDYGRLLLVKVGLVATIVLAAAYNHFVLVKRVATGSGPAGDALRQWRTLRNTVRFEALVIVLVLAVTGVLVNTTPGSDSTAAADAKPVPFTQTKPFTGGSVALAVTPNTAGRNNLEVHVLDKKGQMSDLTKSVGVRFTLPAKNVGPIERAVPKMMTGHFQLDNVTDLSIAGDWTIDLDLRISDFEQETVTFTDTVR